MNQHRSEKPKNATEKNTERVNALLEEARSKVTGLADDAKDAGERFIAKAKDRGEDLVEEAQDKGESAWKAVLGWVKKNPGPAIGYSFVAGLVLRSFLNRSKD